jgi:hypothetical protein
MQPISGEDVEPSLTPASSLFNPKMPNNAVRNALAFGTVDDAITAQGGISSL